MAGNPSTPPPTQRWSDMSDGDRVRHEATEIFESVQAGDVEVWGKGPSHSESAIWVSMWDIA